MYVVQFAESVRSQLKTLTARQRAEALDAIEQQLVHEPLTETRNRKPLRPNPIAPWELRADTLRIFYDAVSEGPGVVRVLAIGIKKGGKLYIGGQEIEL